MIEEPMNLALDAHLSPGPFRGRQHKSNFRKDCTICGKTLVTPVGYQVGMCISIYFDKHVYLYV